MTLTRSRIPEIAEDVLTGVYEVYENREEQRGRKLPLKIVVLPARQPNPDNAPVFYLAGGPGEAATTLVHLFTDAVLREDHDLVFFDSRGTGDGHWLGVPSPRSDDDLQDYLESPFDPEHARDVLATLAADYDLSQYSTAAMIDDLDEVRAALGYDRINLWGGSAGTYTAMMYMRAYGERVRCAHLTSLALLEERIPLHHAASAQWALDQLFDQCAADPVANAAYPDLRDDFEAVLAHVRRGPVPASVPHPVTGDAVEVALDERAFADALRVTMYSHPGGRQVPYLIHCARQGNFDPLAETAVRAGRNFYVLPMGVYLSITATEFVRRIHPDEVEPATRGSFLGSWRVEQQMKCSEGWPETHLPEGYFDPFQSDVPTVLVSGDTDPSTPPKWGEAARSMLPNSVHLVVPGAHVPMYPCIDSITADAFRSGSVSNLDLSCIADIRPIPFRLPSDGNDEAWAGR